MGFDAKFDEWRSCEEMSTSQCIGSVRRRFCAGHVSLEDRSSLFFDRLARKVKHQLFATKKESPEIRIEEVIERDIYDAYLTQVGDFKWVKGKKVHCVEKAEDEHFCGLLGLKWNERILNRNGDFSYVVRGTIQFWLHQKSPIKEFFSVGKQFVENEIENDLVLVFTFVRGDGVNSEYNTNIWK